MPASYTESQEPGKGADGPAPSAPGSGGLPFPSQRSQPAPVMGKRAQAHPASASIHKTELLLPWLLSLLEMMCLFLAIM